MAFSSWRGTAGIIFPTMRPGTLEEVIRILPEGISLLPLFNDVRSGTREELQSVIDGYEAKIKQLVEVGVDVITPAGAPPFMLRGYAGEAALIQDWERKYRVPIFTTGQSDCAALRALNVKRFVGITYFNDDLNQTFAQYLREAGFDCIELAPIGIPFNKMQELASTEIYRFARETLLKHPDAEGVYLLGAWRALGILDMLEADFGVPVVLSLAAQAWQFQRHLHIRQPLTGMGRLLREMP